MLAVAKSQRGLHLVMAKGAFLASLVQVLVGHNDDIQ